MRILQIVDSLDMGGIQTFLLNLNKAIDLSEIQFDYLVFRQHKQVLENEFKDLGATIYKLPNWRNGFITNRKALRNFFAIHQEYEIVHYHAGTLVDIGPLVEAKRAGINVRIMHSHNTHAGGIYLNTIIHRLHKLNVSKLATHYFACGELAAKWMYKGTKAEFKVQIVNNGIDTQRFKFNQNIRDMKKKELRVNNTIIIGHIGRFSEEKNQIFLVNVLKHVCKINKDVRLLFIGDGVNRPFVEEKVNEMGLEKNVSFMGIRKDVSELLQSMDVFVLPSLFEGFPVVLVEAQAAGLPCIISDTISEEVAINPNVKRLRLENAERQWAEEIIKGGTRIKSISALIDAGFDIKNTANNLKKFYLETALLNKDI